MLQQMSLKHKARLGIAPAKSITLTSLWRESALFYRQIALPSSSISALSHIRATQLQVWQIAMGPRLCRDRAAGLRSKASL